MRDLRELNRYRDTDREGLMGLRTPGGDQFCGVFRIPVKGVRRGLFVIASAGNDPMTRTGWDHVSVSLLMRCPTWDEMCIVKDKFFLPTERAMQLHPREDENISNHPFCLDIWRPVTADFPVSPSIMVGIKGLGELSRKGFQT
jgi:hypothetical protein